MKAQIAIDKFIGLAIVVIVMLVVLLGVFPGMREKLAQAAETGTCDWNIFMAGIRKAGTLGIAEGIPEGCKAKRIELTLTDVQRQLGYAKNRLKVINTDPKYKDKAPSFTNDDEKTQYQFAMNKLIADELAGCWAKVLKGKVPIFDEWWRLYSWGTPPAGAGDATRILFTNIHRAPTNCIVCARIKFDDNLVTTFPTKAGTSSIFTLPEWMAVNQWKSGGSYAEFVADGQAETPALLQSYAFDVSNTPLAIVYARINAHQVEEAASWIGTKFGIDVKEQDLNILRIVPYTQRDLISPEGLGCTFVLE